MQEGRDQIGALKDDLLGLKDASLEIKVKAEREGINAVKDDIRSLGSADAITLALSIDPKSENKLDQRLRTLALDRIVKLTLAANPEEAEKTLRQIENKPRQAKILARALTANAEGELKDASVSRVVRLLAEGEVGEARKLLNDTAKERRAKIVAWADTFAARQDLTELQKNRYATLYVNTVKTGGKIVEPGYGDGSRAAPAAASSGVTVNRIYLNGRQLDEEVGRRFGAYESERALSYMMAGV